MDRKQLRSPIAWFGGKGLRVKKLKELIPSHKIYVEAFGGGASLLISKDPSAIEVYNDLNSGLVNFFRVLRHPLQFKRFRQLAQLTPFAREEYYSNLKSWDATADPIERAYRWYVVARNCFAGKFGSGWGYGITTSARGMASAVSRWLGAVEMLPEISSRLMQVQIEHKDAIEIIQKYDTPETFFYLDPPYVQSSRKSGSYEHELTDEQHSKLVEVLLKIKGKVLLSGYPNQIYGALERAGWHKREWPTTCSAAGRTRTSNLQGPGAVKKAQPRTEVVWANYALA
jgi:DNA adenine methylase